ncbi:PREDICTED: alpha-aminoadipic semialdehyde synthase, mitochondrial-like [Priapulus caudatus]|uniref:Alpha-aminoadipic semialdehyde synthase, mitochondrial-like n=1 Tax=Priapulus caudatus TaxID=37621 RepID=A0ABM1EF42_PRICU|nr:PREDICTED: alpha-aminoadipic semialdehyde synthase, mitochondrial-like [Priapulus caudatus]
MECIESVKEQGSTVKSFISYCGGLPAPENSENPLRYKFSWSPLGVFRNAHSGARYLLNGKVVDVPVGGAVLDARQNIDFLPGFNLEAIPNRDSTKYASPYGIESAHTIIRGTLRYRGYCEALKGLLKVGLINDVPHPNLHPMGPEITWKEFMCTLLDQPLDMMLDMLKDAVFDNVKQDNIHYHTIANLGLLSDDVIEKKNTPLATVSHYMAKRLAYGANERDIIVLRHNIAVERADKETEVRHINLVVYGDPRGYSAMAKCVGYPTAIASKMLLEDEIQHKGIVIPLMPEIYRTMLKRLAYEGIVATETVSYPEYSPLHHGTPNNMSAHSNLFYQSAA